MRICYFGTYRADYVRNRLMIDRLRSRGVDVVECHEPLWKSFEDREQSARTGWRSPRFWWRAARAYIRLLKKYRRIGQYDLLMLGYPGQPDVPLARLLSRLRRVPLVWDVLMSLVLIAEERGFSERSPAALKLLRTIEGTALRWPDRLIVDTPAYASWFQERYRIPGSRISLLPLGADDRIFRPFEPLEKNSVPFTCLYYGTYLKSHGVATIMEAAERLKNHPVIRFEMVGDGPLRRDAVTFARDKRLENVRFGGWAEPAEIVKLIGSADLCLGTFGDTPQALVTMQNKIHEPLACARPVITGDSPAIGGLLVHGEHIYLCSRQDSQALAEAIETLYEDSPLRERIAQNGHEFYAQNLAFDRLAEQLVSILSEVAKPGVDGEET